MGDAGAAARMPAEARAPSAGVPWGARLAGGLLLVVGLLNAAFGVLSLASDVVRLGTGAAGGLVVAGALTAAAGWCVWRGSRPVTLVALTIFALLLVSQVGDVAADGGPGAAPGGMAGRFAGVVLLVVVLGVAALQLRRRPPTGRRA